MKSPLALKSRQFKSLTTLKDLIPPDSVVHSFLMYDGVLETSLADADRYVVGHTNRYTIYEFWTCLSQNANHLLEVIQHFDNIEDKNIFYLLQETLPNYADPYVRSAIFFLLCKFSVSGRASSGGFDRTSYNPLALSKLKYLPFNRLMIQYNKNKDFIRSIEDISVRCDYVVIPGESFSHDLLNHAEDEKLQYDESIVNHVAIKECMDTTERKVAVLYHFTPYLLKFYKGHKFYLINKWGRLTQDAEKAEEVIIANF